MKKILSLGAAAAVLSLTAVAASAAITPAFSTDAPVAGETVTVEIVATGMTQEATTFTVEASENLTLTDAVKTDSGLAEFNTETKKFAWAGSSVPADGTVLLTLTYTVDAAADEEISVKLVPDAGFTDISADAITAVVVGGADDVTIDVTSEEVYSSEEESSEDVGLTTTDETTTVEESTEEPADDNKGNDKGNPSTGVALAVVPAVLAGAAIVVAKKRK
ncbi:MAG: NPXTG-anchored protein [Oscillospiraceae bacterium]|nr:NPXTG-anchored protein [Oscillospiraceae bacterium]